MSDTALHANLPIEEIHSAMAYQYADQAARLAATGFQAYDVGKLAWQQSDNTIWMLIEADPAGWIEVTAQTVAAGVNKITINVIKASAGTITKGQAIKVVGWDSPHSCPTVELANASSLFNGPCAGIATESITDVAGGEIMIVGVLDGLDTSGLGGTVGFGVYLNNVDGELVGTAPQGPNFVQPVGALLRIDASLGAIGVNILGIRPLSDQDPAAIGTAAPGTSDFSSRRDHVHAHGDQGGGSEHALAVASGAAGFMSGADKAKLDGLPSLFGQDHQVAKSVARETTTTTSPNWETKVTLTTPALTGEYYVEWHALVDQSNTGDSVQAQLWNDTDSEIVGADEPQEHEPKDTDNRIRVGGWDTLTFTGAAKTFELQWRQVNGSTAGIQDARIRFYRVG